MTIYAGGVALPMHVFGPSPILCASAGMELSLCGAFCALLLANPLVLTRTYLWWACFAGICLYFALSALIYEVVLSGLFRNVPTAVVALSKTSLDVRLPLRISIHMLVFCYYCWNALGIFATSSIAFFGASLHIVVRRLSARSMIPLVSMLFLFKSALEGSLWKFSISLLALGAICCGKHLRHGCARASAILAFVVAVQYMTYSTSTLCAAIGFCLYRG